jgi:hypothetical protein
MTSGNLRRPRLFRFRLLSCLPSARLAYSALPSRTKNKGQLNESGILFTPIPIVILCCSDNIDQNFVGARFGNAKQLSCPHRVTDLLNSFPYCVGPFYTSGVE